MDIFKNKSTKEDVVDESAVVRAFQSMQEARDLGSLACSNNPKQAVRSIERPRFGHGY